MVCVKTSVVLIAPILAALVALFIAWRKFRNDAKLAQAKEWEVIFIKSFSELIENASLFHHGENVVPLGREKHSELMHKANAQKYVLYLILDRNNEEKLKALIHNIVYQMFEGNAMPGENGSPLNQAIEAAILEAQLVRRARLKLK